MVYLDFTVIITALMFRSCRILIFAGDTFLKKTVNVESANFVTLFQLEKGDRFLTVRDSQGQKSKIP